MIDYRSMLIDYMVRRGLVTREQIDIALEEDAAKNFPDGRIRSLGEALCGAGFITEKDMASVYAHVARAETIVVDDSIEGRLNVFIPKDEATKYGMVPVSVVGDDLYVAFKDPLNLDALESARRFSGKRVLIRVGQPTPIYRAISVLYGNAETDKAAKEMESDAEDDDSRGVSSYDLDQEGDSATARYINTIFQRAADEGASDIHIEPSDTETVARIRVDGILRDVFRGPAKLHSPLIARIKIMGNMDTAEKRIPQDGRSNIKVRGESIDLRISSLPTVYGEKIVIRLLRRTLATLDKSAIGLKGEDMKRYDRLLDNHNGVILMVGPTGSGKSTTMITMIKVLNKRDVNLLSLEDPVEFKIPGTSQVQINEKTGMTFARGLRAAMRQDPDIICVGEIRDGETAEIAMRAAITGHLVISTLHTNDALSAFERLKDIGVDSYLIASAVIGVVSQRLVRKICPHCKETYTPDERLFTSMGFDPADYAGKKFYRGKGCPICSGSGYQGRTGVFEILTMTPELRRAVAENVPHAELVQTADGTGYSHLKDSAMRLVLEGTTTLDEIKRIINAID